MDGTSHNLMQLFETKLLSSIHSQTKFNTADHLCQMLHVKSKNVMSSVLIFLQAHLSAHLPFKLICLFLCLKLETMSVQIIKDNLISLRMQSGTYIK